MASKGSKTEDTKTEHPFQAIVVCDGWGDEERWGPLVRRKKTEDEEYDDLEVGGEQRPWCLLPLLNVPLLAWTLESLSASGVEQAFLFVHDGVEHVRDWLASSSFMSPGAEMSITVRPTKAHTPGDVLREVDSLQILAPADYLVVQAGYVGNVNLKEKVDEFTSRRLQDPNLSMSCIVRPIAKQTHSTFAIHTLGANDQLLHYEQSSLYPGMRKFTVPREAFVGGAELQSRSDLEAVGAVICSSEVGPLFTENFDYQFFYPDFVNGLLTSDLLGKTICCTVLESDPASSAAGSRAPDWAFAVSNTKSYDAMSKAILARKAYPMAPDENMPNGSTRYEQRRARVYYGQDVDLSRTCKISSTSLIGSASRIGPNTYISHSVLGSSVQTGSSCQIVNSYVFEGAVLGDGCVVRDSVIGEGVRIAAGAVIEHGCLVAAGTVVGEGARLQGCRVSLEEYDGDEFDVHGSSLGRGAQGFLWPAEDQQAEEDDSDDEDAVDPRNLNVTRLGARSTRVRRVVSASSLSSLSRDGSDATLDSDDSMTDDDEGGYTSDAGPAIAGLDALQPESSGSGRKQSEFMTECIHSLDRSFAEGHTVDNASIELKTLRMASNVPLNEVRAVVVPYVLRRAGGAAGAADTLDRWGGLIASLTGDQDDAMVDCVLRAQEFVAAGDIDSGVAPGDVRMWLRVLKGFYENDVVSDDAVFAWYKSVDARKVGGDEGRKLWAASRPFLEAIQDDDDDEDDDSEDESD
ncbi:hypothetical protein BMF94_4346 [Rhodotorula taiwanensis]|uniref:Translation initiation factor eIF2B subunit epsilon n=1 Tax=Rhodotorula taiwanensis TaxID=741276 RepID=A0A2S5B6W9_9BASI|nr:hypothetical protein BMF94_4346 [Rhodotorula taiwanensis]